MVTPSNESLWKCVFRGQVGSYKVQYSLFKGSLFTILNFFEKCFSFVSYSSLWAFPKLGSDEISHESSNETKMIPN